MRIGEERMAGFCFLENRIGSLRETITLGVYSSIYAFIHSKEPRCVEARRARKGKAEASKRWEPFSLEGSDSRSMIERGSERVCEELALET